MTSSYSLTSSLQNGKLQVILSVFCSPTDKKVIRMFGKVYSNADLPSDIKNNFSDIQNIHSILNQTSQSCQVNIQTGAVTLIYSATFPNGKKFTLEGTLQLQEQQISGKSDIDQKIQKLEGDIKKLILSAKTSTQNNKQIKKIHQNIINDIQVLKNSCQELLKWKKKQQQNFKQPNIKNQLINIIDEKFDQFKQLYSVKIQKQAQKMDDIKSLIGNMQKKTDKLYQDNTDFRKMIKQLTQDKQNYSSKIQKQSQKLQDLQDILLQQKKKVDKLIQDSAQQKKSGKLPQERLTTLNKKIDDNETKIMVISQVIVKFAAYIQALSQQVAKQSQQSKININIIDLQNMLQLMALR